jgi:catechol 2,3-dioxygenase-like lactoylglutathione lyase family enzyme
MISGGHVIVYSRDADADRAFFADVLRLASVDAGGGWLIFALPPAEVAVHPGKNDLHELYLMCEDLRATVDQLKARGIRCDAPEDLRWGLRTSIRLPGGGRLGLYQPKHLSPNRPPRRSGTSRARAAKRPATRAAKRR